MKLFAVFPEEVISINDFSHHFVSAQALIRLYRVNPKECVVIDYRDPITYCGLTNEYIHSLMPLGVKVGDPGVDYRPITEDERQRVINRILNINKDG